MSKTEPLYISQLLDGCVEQCDSKVRKENIPFFKNIFDLIKRSFYKEHQKLIN